MGTEPFLQGAIPDKLCFRFQALSFEPTASEQDDAGLALARERVLGRFADRDFISRPINKNRGISLLKRTNPQVGAPGPQDATKKTITQGSKESGTPPTPAPQGIWWSPPWARFVVTWLPFLLAPRGRIRGHSLQAASAAPGIQFALFPKLRWRMLKQVRRAPLRHGMLWGGF